jgi:hypothetical protein
MQISKFTVGNNRTIVEKELWNSVLLSCFMSLTADRIENIYLKIYFTILSVCTADSAGKAICVYGCSVWGQIPVFTTIIGF